MGIPSYFNHIIKNHKKIFRKIKDYKKIDNLYLDSNSIIYDSLREIDTTYIRNEDEYEEILIQNVCHKIKTYIEKVKPSNVFIAFDGVAPVAKLEQQRQRRYKSLFSKNIEQEIKKGTNKEHTCKINWDQTSITPGTEFMAKLNNFTRNFFKNPLEFGCIKISVCGSDIFGEGEHKIFDYIRKNKDYHKNTFTLIYGLDADLIMLCLNHLHISKHINLFREKPNYETDLDEYYDENDICILQIKSLSETIINEMTDYKKINNVKLLNNKIFDYILISFLLGNDFMPHIPSLNIRTNGISIILETYKNTIKVNETIYDGKRINWNKMRKLIQELANNEYNNLMNEYKLIHKQKSRVRQINDKSSVEDKLLMFNLLPTQNREIEDLIDPTQKGWEYRYYKTLFDIHINNDYRKKICNNYLEGLEWTMKYYTIGCVNYRWFYKYHYAPLLTDLVKYIPHFDTDFIEENYNKVSSLTQLAYVLPGKSLDLLPENIKNSLLHKYINYYSREYTFIWAFCKYFWECHAKLPHIDINEIEELVQSV
jgi:5'-3' exonuclease